MKKTILLVGCTLLLVLHVSAQTTWYVNAGSGNDNNTGKSWGLAFATFQKALSSAVSGDQIWVAAGTYRPASDSSFAMVEGVKIYGGFAGTETLLSARDWTANVTTLKGNRSRVIYNVNNGLTAAAVLDGFTVTGGYTTSYGGGIYNYNASPTITNVTISGNTASSQGGGIYNDHASPAITNVTISGNTASFYGGGIYNINASPAITNVTISGNTASLYGGGIYNINASPAITNVTISGNWAYNGGGIYNINASPAITNVTISGNTANLQGGGIYNDNASPAITNVTISGNTVSFRGGGIYNDKASPAITNVTISGNTASFQGGGIYNDNGSNGSLTNVTMYKNMPEAINSTGGLLYICNSIIWGNGAGLAGSNYAQSTYNSLIQGNTGTGNGNIAGSTDPLFANAAAGNFALQSNSPAINAGSNALFAGLDATTTDLAGNPRVYNFAADGIIDMGAYEHQGETTLPVSLSAFTATAVGKTALLQWQTLTETGNDHFDVQRSGDGKAFATIGSVAGFGTTAVVQDYGYTDAAPLTGRNYYRLAQVDFDGRTAYSGVRSLTFSANGGTLTASPNPTTGELNVTLPAAAAANAVIGVYALDGRLVWQQSVAVGTQTVQLQLGSLPAGLYLLRYGSETVKVIKR